MNKNVKKMLFSPSYFYTTNMIGVNKNMKYIIMTKDKTKVLLQTNTTHRGKDFIIKYLRENNNIENDCVIVRNKPIKRRKKGEPKSRKELAKDCDILWAKVVKARAGYQCEVTGKKTHLQSHHLVGRQNKTLRWDLDNGISLSAGVHTLSSQFSFHGTPNKALEWFEKYKPGLLQRLQIKGNYTNKQDLKLTKIYLERELKKYE